MGVGERCVVVSCAGGRVVQLVPQELRHAVGDGVASGGADTLLAPGQERELVSLLLQGPGAHGWQDQQWTLARINRLIDERFGRCYADPSGVWRMMDRLGLSWQVPAVRAGERDEEGIAVWRTQVWPRAERGSAPVRGVDRLR